MRVDSAFACAKPPIAVGVVPISAPPDKTRSASPYWMQRAARPRACVDVVQAVTTPRFGHRKPKCIDRCPASILMMEPGM